MNKKAKGKQKILIVDDFEINRAILSEMLGEEYEIIEAENGAQAVAVLQKEGVGISLVLLDIIMPVMNGYEVLNVMNEKGWIKDIPVIMISSENSPASINRAYDKGIMDFISRPFDIRIVRRRVKNIILLFAKQKKLENMVADQIYEKEKTSNLMISILSHIVEFRNGESGLHVLHVQALTGILLKSLLQKTDKYSLTPAEVDMISMASALHDIGKIAIPGEILNKPGRLTDEEFKVMKTHSAIGADMLKSLDAYTSEPLIKFAHEICRWHHERFDGRGYPDGLKGDEIPVSAQIVALADVYDALTSDRVYKKAFSHEKACEMILNGECGSFNPLILECFKESQNAIKSELDASSLTARNDKEIKIIADKMLKSEELSSSEHLLRMLENERVKNDFMGEQANEIWFDYTYLPSMITFSTCATEKLGVPKTLSGPAVKNILRSSISAEDSENLKKLLSESTRRQPIVTYKCKLKFGGVEKNSTIICRTVWSSDDNPENTGIFGKIETENI